MSYTVYKHISPSGKVYVGITKRKPEYRWNHGKNYRKDQLLFYRAIQKYGWDNFTHVILYTGLSERDAKNIEISLIKQYKALGISYNMTDGGDGGKGLHGKRKPLSEETKKKMSQSRKGIFIGSNNPMYGRHETSSAYGKYGENHPASKKVYQYTLDGNFIKEWGSITDAVKFLGKGQYSASNITAVCKGKLKTAFGYQWSYTKSDSIPAARVHNVYKYDSNTGELIGEYKNTKEAALSIVGNPSASGIINCCNGKAETAYGYIWKRYKVEKLQISLSVRSMARQGYELKQKQINKTKITTTK